MANKLMFQVGVEQAVAGLDKVKKELDQFVTDYGKKMQIQVDVKNLEAFINALKTIGSGEQLRPLLDQVERLQNRLTAMADKNTYLDFVKGEAAAAAATLKIAQENYEKVKKLGNVVNTSDRKRELDNAFIKNEEAQSRLNSALERLKTEEKSAGDAAIDLKTRLDAVKNSVQDLNSRVGGGIKFEVDKDLKNFDFKSLLRNLTSLADKKDKATVGESSLATETNKARATLAAEEMQAEKTAAALNNATNSIIAATLAAKNMYTVMGGNSSEVAKFMELANQMDAVNRKIALVMSQEKGDFSKGKNNVLGDLNKEMADIQARMDELKKSTSIGNPIVEAFTSAYSGLASVLKEAGSAMSNTSGSVKKLDEAMTQAIQNGNKPIVDTAQANASAQAVEKQAVTFEQVKKSLESVYALIERVQAMPVMKGNFGMMGEWDMISKEKLANMQTFAKSVRFMQDELKEATTVETLRSSDSTLIDSLKEYLNAIKQTITFAKKELKKNLGEEEAAELQKKIAILEQLKASYNDAYSVLSKKNNLSNFANFEGYNITKENFAAKKADIDQVNEAIRKTFEEEGRVAKSKTQVAEATEKNTQALTQEAQSAGMTKEQMEALAAAKQKVNEAEQNQTKVNKQNEQTLKTEGEQAKKTAKDMESLKNAETQGGSGAFADVERIIRGLEVEVNKLVELFAKLGNSEGLKQMQSNMESINQVVGSLKESLSSLSSAFKFQGNKDEIAAYEKQIKDLKAQIESLQTNIKQINEGIKTVASGKGSEATQNKNLDALSAQLEKVRAAYEKMQAEYDRMEAAGAQNAGLKERINTLKQYIEWIEKVAKTDLSKAGALSATDVKFNDQMLFGQMNRQMYSDKAVKEFSKLVDESIKAKNVADSLNDAFERMKQHILGVGTAGSGGMRGVSDAMESINRIGERNIQTLIQERAHVERLISLANKSINFGEVHDVAGMQGLRVQQRENLEYLNNLKRAIDHILENRNMPEWMRFLNTPGSLRIPYPGSGNDFALLGAHYDILAKNVTGTSTAMRQLKKEMQFDNLTESNKAWNTDKLKTGLYDVQQMIERIKAEWDKVGEHADVGMTKTVANTMNALNDLRNRIASAMSDDSLLGTRRGFSQVLNADSGIIQKDAKAVLDVLTKTNNEREKAAEKTAKAEAAADEKMAKQHADLMAKREKQERAYDQVWQKGLHDREQREAKAADKKAQKEAQLDEKLIKQHADLMAKREKQERDYEQVWQKGLREREMREAKTAEKTVKSREKAAQAEKKSVDDAIVQYNRLEGVIYRLSVLRESAANAKVDTTWVDSMIGRMRVLQEAYESIYAAKGKTANGLMFGDIKNNPVTRSYMQELGLVFSETNKQITAGQKVIREREKEVERELKAEEKAAALRQKFEAERQKMYSDMGLRQNDPGLQNISNAMEAILPKLAKVREDIEALKSSINSGSKEGIPFINENIQLLESQANAMMRQYVALAEARDRLAAGGKEAMPLSGYFHDTVQQNKELEMLNETFRNGTSILQQRAKAEDEAAKSAKNAADNAAKENKMWADSMDLAKVKAKQLANQIKDLETKEKVLSGAGIDTTGLKAAIEQMRQNLEILQGMAAGSKIYGTAQDFTSRSNAQYQTPIIEGNATAKRLNAQATNQLATEEQKLAQAISHSSHEMKNQSMVLGDLRMMAYQYLSVWGAQSFVNSIIETGGLLEQQRLSIGAILQNAGQATELFGKIKQLALKSPFGVVELDKMSKQLTAYGFEYKELYDWTKRLADISAATGTSVDRLALALGHVRAEGALSGYTLRQFAMGNVPMLRMLAENLNISTKQVREKVRKKDISYEDVMNVLQQLTDKGGMFYEAQETMSQALNAKFKNLRDAFDIMYNEIAEGGVGESLKELAGILTTGAKHWRELGDVIMWTAGAFGITKAAMLLCNQAIGAGTAATLKSAAADKQKEVNMLRLAKEYRALSAEEWKLLATHSRWYATSGKLTSAQLSLLLSEKKLGQEELYRAVALRKINKELAEKAILEMQAATEEEVLAKKEMLMGLQGVKVLGRTRVAWLMLGNAIRSAGKALWSFTKMALPMAAFSAIVELFSRTNQMIEQSKEAAHDLAEKATSDMKVLNETLKELQSNNYIKLSENSGKYINGHRVVQMDVVFNDEALQKEDLTDEINTLKNKLQDMSPLFAGDLVDIDKMENQVDQFKAIVEKLESIRHANDVTEAMSDVVMDANVDSAGPTFLWKWGDTYAQNMKDYENRMKDMEKYVNSINEETIDGIDKDLDGQLTRLKNKYSLDSKNNALGMLFADWARQGGVPLQYKSKIANTKIEELYGKATSGGFMGLGENLKGRFEQLENDTKFMAEKLSSIIKQQFEEDPQGAIYAITNYMRKLISVAGITDPRVIEEVRRMMIDEMRNYLPKNMIGDVADAMQVKILQEQFTTLLGNSITDTSTPEEIEKAKKAAIEGANKWGEMMKYDMAQLGEKAAEAYNYALKAKLNSVQLKVEWQKRASKIFVQNVSIKSNFDKNLDEFAQAVQKDLKEKQAYLDRNKQHLMVTFNVDANILMNADKLKAFMAALRKQAFEKARKGDLKGSTTLLNKIKEELNPYYDALMAVQEDKTYLKSEGFPEKDPTKGNKGSKEDKNAKEVRERVRILKEANDSYQYWRKLVGDTAAQPHVNEEFGKLLGEQGFKFEDAKQYEKTLEDLRKKYQGIYDASEKAGKKRPQLLEAIKEIDKVLADLGRKDFEKATEDFLSKTQIELDNLTRSWETFNTVREATGDINLAIELSGADYEAGQTRNLADAVKQKIEEEFAAVGAVQIPFDIYMSDKEIEDSIKAAMPKANETQIKAFVEDYKKWRDLQRDVLKNDVQIFAKIIGSSQDYATQLQKITNDYDKNKESLDNMLKLYNSGQVDEKGNRRGINTDQYMKALQQIDADKELKVLKLGDQYAMYMAGAFGVMRDNVVETAQTIESKLNKAMKANVIDAKTYAEEMRKVRDMLDKYREESFFGKENPFVAFMNGGLKGSNDYVKSAIQALESKNGPLTAEEQKQLKTLKELQSSLSKTIGGLSSFAKVLLIAQGVVDGFSSAAQTLSDMFDALGQEGAANFWSDVSDSIKAGSSFLQPVNNILQNALSGNIGGVLSSAISAPVDLIAGPIIGFAQLSDKRHERRIQELKQEVTKIDNTLNTIKSLRERELGYDSGSLRRQMAAMYKSAYYSSSNDEPYSTIRGMREYYGRFSGGNGYSQEYNALIATRKKYMEMYDEEYEKKNSSNEALEEYKTKIAELDEQIMFFTEDLANELWGIDIQGWADQVADSIWTAFENGEDAVEAFGDTARDIVSSVAKEMWQLSVLEPRFKELREALFGPNGAIKYDSNGNIDMKASEQPVMEVLGKYLGPNGIFQQDIAAGEEFYNWVQKITGIDLSKESSSNASASIKNITEETADLLASYLNACRADVAANRAMIADYFPQYLSVMTSSNASLRNLEEQARLTAANTDAIKKSNQAILDNINGLKNKTWQVPIA